MIDVGGEIAHDTKGVFHERCNILIIPQPHLTPPPIHQKKMRKHPFKLKDLILEHKKTKMEMRKKNY